MTNKVDFEGENPNILNFVNIFRSFDEVKKLNLLRCCNFNDSSAAAATGRSLVVHCS